MMAEQMTSAVAYYESLRSEMARIMQAAEAVEAVDEAVKVERDRRPGRRTPEESAIIRRETREAWERIQSGESRVDVARSMGLRVGTLTFRFYTQGLSKPRKPSKK